MKKRILFLITTLNSGGAEKILVDTVNLLPKGEYEITVQTILDGGPLVANLSEDIRYKQIFYTKNRITVRIINKIIKLMPRLIYRMYIKDDYDIEVAFLEGKPTRLISYSSEKEAKKIAWIHTDLYYYFDSRKDYMSISENKKAYSKFDAIACVSEDVKSAYIKRFNNEVDNVEVLYNIIESDVIKKKADEPIKENEYCREPVVMACGRLCEQKGFDRLLKIHKRLISEGIKHKLWIIGEGTERPNLEGYIFNNKIERTAILWGFQNNPYKFMKKADLFVCSSIAEGYSTVVTEATILGVPVISVNVAGAKEPLECPRCNVVVDNTEEALYEGMKDILLDKNILEKYKMEQFKKSSYFEKEKLIKRITNFLEG